MILIMAELTDKQARFVEEYLIDLNGARAAVRAGYSLATANSLGPKILNKPVVQAALAARQLELRLSSGVSVERVIAEYAKIGFASMGTFATWSQDGVVLKDSKDLTPSDLAAVAEVTEVHGEKTKTIRFKLHDKKGALDSLAKHLGMFVERVDITERKEFVFLIGHGYVEPDDPRIIEGEVTNIGE